MSSMMHPIAAIARDPIGWSLLLVGSDRVGDRLRLQLVGDELTGFAPGENECLSIWVMCGAPLHRSCRIDGFDPTELRLDLTLRVAGDEEFENWAAAAEIGDLILVEPQAAKTRIETEDHS